MPEQLLLFAAIGFAAQLVDGAIGMAYGLTGTSVLLGFGVPPATASASIHAAELFTTGASGLAHWRFGNIQFAWVARLAIPGMIGGAVGAFLLVSFPSETVRPFVSAYLLAMGVLIIRRAMRNANQTKEPKRIEPLGLVGGFLDAVGGGGWGSIVTSTLIGRGASPRFAIGSVNMAEFFVTATISATFLATIGLELWPIIAGLVAGGILAAPLAALATKKLPHRPLMMLVGSAIVLLSVRELHRALA
jgi:hypothetical protein